MPRAESQFRDLALATDELASFAEPFVAAASGGKAKPDIQLALQEVVNDLFDGFLSEEDRNHLTKGGVVPKPDVPRPPQVELQGAPGALLPSFNKRSGVIGFPTWLAQPDGVPVWVSLAHETCGHAILTGYGLERRLRRQVKRVLPKRGRKQWSTWFDEAASDCLAVLNLGPTMALGSIAAWRAHSRLTGSDGKLPREPLEKGKRHPPPILRAYMMAHVATLLTSPQAKREGATLKRLIRRELRGSKYGERDLQSVEEFARIVVDEPHPALNDFRFLNLQDWRDKDDEVVAQLRVVLRQEYLPRRFGRRHYAAHALAAAILEWATRPRPAGTGHRVLVNLIHLLRRMYESDRGRKSRRELQMRA